MRHQRFVVVALLVLFTSTLTVSAQVATEDAAPAAPDSAQVLPPAPTQEGQTLTTSANEVIYVVRPGDTLFRIAVRFHTTVRALATANNIINPALIYAGQSIRVPGLAPTPTPLPAPTASPTATLIPIATQDYIVRTGDTLFKIALRFKTTVTMLVNLNTTIRNPNLIYVGQRLKVPADGSIPPTPAPTFTPAGSGAALVPTAGQGGGTVMGYGFDYGIEAYLVDQDVASLTSEIQALKMGWVKQVVNWRDFEVVQGQIDFATLDGIVDALNAIGVNILLNVTGAPDWARPIGNESGPPSDLTTFGTFISALATRYVGRVQAYEIWSEPNIRLNWSCADAEGKAVMCSTRYIDLLSVGYAAVKAADPDALVISAGLAPTGWNDGKNGLADRQFLSDLYANGLANVSDAVGAHPLGWANPPDAVCCDAPAGVETHYQDPTFYFRNTLEDYRKIMVAANDSSTPIWVTKFGWGTSEDTAAPSSNNVYFTYTDLTEQATYDPRGFALGAELGFVGPMFLSNLNGCHALPGSAECYYSLIGPNGARPVFQVIADRATSSPETLIPEEAVPTAETLLQPTLEPTPISDQGMVEPETTPGS